jgi:hypothetical protein
MYMQYSHPMRRLLTHRFVIPILAFTTAVSVRADYKSLVLSDNPKAYYRLNDSTVRSPINVNSGTLGPAGNATNDGMFFKGGSNPTGVVHPFPGAIVGDGDRAEFFDSSTRTEVPFNPAFNTPNTQPFTVEAWFYPATDQTGSGMAPINNRYTLGANRQGWTFFQRRPDSSYTPGDNGLGWNFRMYNGVGGAAPMDVQSAVPFSVGKWQHVVVTFDPLNDTNATLSIYIDGVLASSTNYLGVGYAPCTGDHLVSEATTGQPNLSIGSYNNANTSLNPYFGAVDEFAWYSNKLSPAQILAHYQNATNASRTTPYDVLVKSANPVVYLRLDEIAPGPDFAVNLGDVRATGLFTNTPEVRYSAASALTNRADDKAYTYHWRNGSSTTDLPFLADNNPAANVPFTVEGWFRPTNDRQNPGAAVINNRLAGSAVNRSGWVIFQRAPNNEYSGVSGYSGVGWNFRMFTGSGSLSSDVTSGVPYNVGEWQHVVTTWDGGTVLTMYVNGVQVAQNISASYAANTSPPQPPDDALAPVDFAVGSYNKASGFGNNPFEGDVDEVAFYANYMLTADQIMEHYQAGTNAHPDINYETLVFKAGLTNFNFAERAGLPKTYLRFSDPGAYPMSNSGTLGPVADGSLILASNTAAGPLSPTFPGFEANNTAVSLDGAKQFGNFNHPAGLNFFGQISLEAWVKPGATQVDPARIISHGPQTVTAYPSTPFDNTVTNTSEVFLRIDGSGAYVVGSAAFTNGLGTTYYYATAPMPGGDLGSSTWIHLVGTYDGANWRLFRNGALLAISPTALGALTVDNGDWAIGSTGNGWADPFNGLIDEVAIYNYALSTNQIQGHYNAGTVTPKITITKSGSNVILSWPYGTLYQADNITGPWTAVPGSPTSPLTVSAGAARKFYRF